jgi:hypothetical protein
MRDPRVALAHDEQAHVATPEPTGLGRFMRLQSWGNLELEGAHAFTVATSCAR